MRKAMALLVVACSGCSSTYLDISAGPQIDPIFRGPSNWHGSGPVVDVAVRKEWAAWFCQFAHTSNLFSGPPFNGDTETTLDRITCGRSFRLGGEP